MATRPLGVGRGEIAPNDAFLGSESPTRAAQAWDDSSECTRSADIEIGVRCLQQGPWQAAEGTGRLLRMGDFFFVDAIFC